MLRIITVSAKANLLHFHDNDPQALVSVYPMLDGRTAVVFNQHPDAAASVVNLVEVFAREAMKQLPELKGKKASQIVWFTTFWVSSMYKLDKGATAINHDGPYSLFSGDSPFGRKLMRAEMKLNLFGDRFSVDYWDHQHPEAESLLRYVEASAYHSGWPVPSEKNVQARYDRAA